MFCRFKLIVFVFLVCTVFSNRCVGAGFNPDTPFTVSCTIGTPPAEYSSMLSPVNYSCEPVLKELEEDPKWFRAVALSPDIAIDLIGRFIVPGTHSTNQLSVIWFVLNMGGFKYSFFGTDKLDTAEKDGARNILFWARANYSQLKSRSWIPGGFKTVEFPLRFLEQKDIEDIRWTVYVTEGQTPQEYSRWEKGKENSVKDMKEGLRKWKTGLRLTENESDADAVVKVMGRGSSLEPFDYHQVLWLEVVVHGKTNTIAPFVQADNCPGGCWRAIARDGLLRVYQILESEKNNTAAESSTATLGLETKQEPSSSSTSKNTKPLTNQDVIDLVKAGLNEQNVVMTIREAESTRFDLSVEQIKALLANSVSNAIISEMRKKQSGSK